MKIPAHLLKPLAYAGGGALVVTVCLSLSAFWHLANAEERFHQRMAEWHARASLMVEQHDAHLIALAAVLEAGDVAVFDKTAAAILTAYSQIESINLEAPKAPAAGRYRVERVVGQSTIGMTIDAHDLLPRDTGEISVNVELPDGTLLAGAPIEDADFAQPLASQSQPLLMSASFAPKLETLFPPVPSLGIVALALLTYAMAVIAGGQFIGLPPEKWSSVK